MSVALFGILAFAAAALHLLRPEEARFWGAQLRANASLLAVSAVAGVGVEVAYILLRYHRSVEARWRRVAGAIAADYGAAAALGLVLFALLSSPALDGARTGRLAGVAAGILLTGTLAVGAVVHKRWAPAPVPVRSPYVSAILTLSGQIVVSLASALLAGKLYLLIAGGSPAGF